MHAVVMRVMKFSFKASALFKLWTLCTMRVISKNESFNFLQWAGIFHNKGLVSTVPFYFNFSVMFERIS